MRIFEAVQDEKKIKNKVKKYLLLGSLCIHRQESRELLGNEWQQVDFYEAFSSKKYPFCTVHHWNTTMDILTIIPGINLPFS